MRAFFGGQMSLKRPLTETEIEQLLSSFDEYFLGLDDAMRAHTAERLRAPFREKLRTVLIYPEMIGHLREEIMRKFRCVEAGKSVGIITGQSIGEMQTQMTLNTFHHAGFSEKAITSGVPRFLELIYTSKSKTQLTQTCIVYIKEDLPRESALRQLIKKTFGALVTLTDLDSAAPPWETNYFAFFGAREASAARRLLYSLNIDILFRYRIALAEIVEMIRAEFPELTVAFSPLHLGQICVYLDSAQHYDDIHIALMALPICGIPGITHAFYLPNTGGEPGYHIETEGTNLAAILRLPFVDVAKTFSNDIWEIYAIFGIEAVRQMILRELQIIMPSVHLSHITLLVDRMTVSGRLRSITRYTRKNENTSILSKTTFEETLSNFLRAGFFEEKDAIVGCSASVIFGKVAKIGTGMNTLFLE